MTANDKSVPGPSFSLDIESIIGLGLNDEAIAAKIDKAVQEYVAGKRWSPQASVGRMNVGTQDDQVWLHIHVAMFSKTGSISTAQQSGRMMMNTRSYPKTQEVGAQPVQAVSTPTATEAAAKVMTDAELYQQILSLQAAQAAPAQQAEPASQAAEVQIQEYNGFEVEVEPTVFPTAEEDAVTLEYLVGRMKAEAARQKAAKEAATLPAAGRTGYHAL